MDVFSPQDYALNILRFSKRMHEMACADDWQTFSELEAERQRVIEALFSHPDMPAKLADVAELLTAVIEMDAASIALGEKARQDLTDTLSSLRQRRQVASAYQNVANH